MLSVYVSTYVAPCAAASLASIWFSFNSTPRRYGTSPKAKGTSGQQPRPVLGRITG